MRKEILETRAGIVDWGYGAFSFPIGPSKETLKVAAYLAECVRWRRAWDKATKKGTHYNLRTLPKRMWEVMNP
jgi:hypothetical protein